MKMDNLYCSLMPGRRRSSEFQVREQGEAAMAHPGIPKTSTLETRGDSIISILTPRYQRSLSAKTLALI